MKMMIALIFSLLLMTVSCIRARHSVGGPPKEDLYVGKCIRDRLAVARSITGGDVTVEHGYAILTGSAKTSGAKTSASNFAYGCGAQGVRNHIMVGRVEMWPSTTVLSLSADAERPTIGAMEMKRISRLVFSAANDSVLLKGALLDAKSEKPSASEKVDMGKLKSAINGFFEKRYHSNYKVLREASEDAGGSIDIVVENIRGEITKQKLWEKITMYTVFYATGTQVRINLVVDAKVASGINPPGDQDYDDLDKLHFARLLDYTKAFLTEMARYLEAR